MIIDWPNLGSELCLYYCLYWQSVNIYLITRCGCPSIKYIPNKYLCNGASGHYVVLSILCAYSAYTGQIWDYNWVYYVLLQIYLVDKHCKRQLTKSCVYMPHWGRLRQPPKLPTIITEQGWHLAYLRRILSRPHPPRQMTWQQHKSISIRAFNREFVDSKNLNNCMDNRNYIRDMGSLNRWEAAS